MLLSNQTLIWLRFLLICAFAALIAPSVFAKGSFAVKPAGSWVRTIKPDSSANSQQSGSSSTFLLDDHQVRVGSGTVERYYHHVQRIDTAAGLDDLSSLQLEFEPSYQRLAIHFIRILRGNETINSLNPAEIKVIQQEEELNQQLFDGTLEAVVFLNDLRVGDVIDYAYTVSGENPVLGGRYVERFDLADSQPMQHLTLRVLYPSSRTISIKTSNIDIQPQIGTLGNETEYFWERRNVAAIDYEDFTPGWFDPYPTISMSEFQNWGDVVQWAAPLYQLPATYTSKLAARIEVWKTQFSTPAERAIAALRFVQDEIRYLGIEMGRYSHQPTTPDKVFSRRFGDCKDKSFLLVAMLNAMNIDAAPALVNTSARRALDSWQPSPYAFDHVIVQAVIDGKTYWFDATQSYQRGGLQQYYDPSYERALVIRPGKTGLDKIPLPASGSGSTVIDEQYTSWERNGPIALSVTTTYQGSDADAIRYSLSTRSMADLSKYYLNFYAEYNPSIRAERLPEVDDDQNNNRIIVREKYVIDSFWKDGRHRFIAERVNSEVTKPRVSQRSMPLSVAYPVSITHRTVIKLPETFRVQPDRITIANDAIKFDYSCSSEGNAIKLEYAVRTLADSVPVDKVQGHLESVDRIQNLVGFELTTGAITMPVFASRQPGIGVIGTLIGFIVFPGVVLLSILLIQRRRKAHDSVPFATLLMPKRGSTPEAAIRVSSENEVDEMLMRFECRCGQRPYNRESPPLRERFRYDGELLSGMRLYCQGCGQDTDLYINVKENRSDVVELGLNSIESTRQ